MIYTVSAGPQSYGQINFDLLNHMSSFVVVSVSNDSLLFFLLWTSKFYSFTAETANENFVDTSEVRTLIFVR